MTVKTNLMTMAMRRIITFIMALALTATTAGAITAKQVLDKTSAVLSNKGGATAQFTISGDKISNASGTITVKGRKFHATTPAATVWFDGKTQWTYLKRSNEVNVSNPNESELQAINPYNFINIYRSGYSMSMKTVGSSYQVHLTATNKSRKLQEMYITVGKSNYVPTQIRMRQGKKWTTIKVSNFKRANYSDATFRFNSKDFPSAEVIDLR